MFSSLRDRYRRKKKSDPLEKLRGKLREELHSNQQVPLVPSKQLSSIPQTQQLGYSNDNFPDSPTYNPSPSTSSRHVSKDKSLPSIIPFDNLQMRTNTSQTIQRLSEQNSQRYRHRHYQKQTLRKPVPSSSILTNSRALSASADPSDSLSMSSLTLSSAGSSASSAGETPFGSPEQHLDLSNSAEIQPCMKGRKMQFASVSNKAFKPLEGNTKEIPTTYILLRHAQGEHNVTDANGRINSRTRDPVLTSYGREECSAKSHAAFMTPDGTRMLSVTYIVASPMRRALQTALLYFAPLLASKPEMRVVAMPILIERGVSDASIGSPIDKLVEEFKDQPIDFSLVKKGWEYEHLATNHVVLQDRAAEARKQLFEIGENMEKGWTGKGKYIAVVAHGEFLRFVVQSSGFHWKNAGFAEFCFDRTPEGNAPTNSNFEMSPIPEFTQEVNKKVKAFDDKYKALAEENDGRKRTGELVLPITHYLS